MTGVTYSLFLLSLLPWSLILFSTSLSSSAGLLSVVVVPPRLLVTTILVQVLWMCIPSVKAFSATVLVRGQSSALCYTLGARCTLQNSAFKESARFAFPRFLKRLTREYRTVVDLDKAARDIHLKRFQGVTASSAAMDADDGTSNGQVVVLAGATSAGKSAAALELCRHLNAEIVVCDSVQIYKYLDIGSNKPTKVERDAVPHHLVDIREPNERCSSGQFVRMAAEIIRDIIARGKTPIVVGGTTMWLNWLVHGIPDAPVADSESVRKAAELIDTFEATSNWEGAVEFARQFDDRRLDKVAKNDWYRLRRIYEIGVALNKSGNGRLSPDSEAGDDGERNNKLDGSRTRLLGDLDLRCFFLCEEREILYRTIDQRCDDMLNAGLLKEVKNLLLDNKIDSECMGARAIGYKQSIQYFLRQPYEKGDAEAFRNFLM
jgi:tRNA dimethylallyltransferase